MGGHGSNLELLHDTEGVCRQLEVSVCLWHWSPAEFPIDNISSSIGMDDNKVNPSCGEFVAVFVLDGNMVLAHNLVGIVMQTHAEREAIHHGRLLLFGQSGELLFERFAIVGGDEGMEHSSLTGILALRRFREVFGHLPRATAKGEAIEGRGRERMMDGGVRHFLSPLRCRT